MLNVIVGKGGVAEWVKVPPPGWIADDSGWSPRTGMAEGREQTHAMLSSDLHCAPWHASPQIQK